MFCTDLIFYLIANYFLKLFSITKQQYNSYEKSIACRKKLLIILKISVFHYLLYKILVNISKGIWKGSLRIYIKQVKKYLSIGYKFTVIIIIGISLFCYIGQKHIFNWIVSDDSVILSAENLILWLFVMALTKVGYQIYMVYLQGIGKERDILQSTIAAMIIASISIVVSGKVFSLSGVYFVISSKYLILSIIYFRQAKSME